MCEHERHQTNMIVTFLTRRKNVSSSMVALGFMKKNFINFSFYGTTFDTILNRIFKFKVKKCIFILSKIYFTI